MVVQAWKRIPILLYVKTIKVLTTFNNIFALMVEACFGFWWPRTRRIGS
jgi:hypothetical protein